MKVCTNCKIDKGLSEFYKRADTKVGVRSICIECMKTEHSRVKPPRVRYADMAFVPCATCKEVQPRSEYRSASCGDNKSYRGIDRRCQSCSAKRGKDYYQRDKVKSRVRQRASKLKMCYGITEAHYESLLLSQSSKCAICLTDDPKGKGKFNVDHCHSSGKVRALLCTNCNTGLGQFKDSVSLLELAARYLNAHNKV